MRFHKHDMQLYIYYHQYSYIYRCSKCGKLVYFDIEQVPTVCIDDQNIVQKVRNTICQALKIPNDNMIIARTQGMRDNLKTKDDLTNFITDTRKNLEKKEKQPINKYKRNKNG